MKMKRNLQSLLTVDPGNLQGGGPFHLRTLCPNKQIPGNYGFCVVHRTKKRKSANTMTVGGDTWDALPVSMSTISKYMNFLGNAQTRGKRVEIIKHRWLLLVCSPCAYLGHNDGGVRRG